jgi:hypothetical protein
MKSPLIRILALLSLCASIASGIDFERLLEVNPAAEQWVVHGGYPLYYSSRAEQFRVDGKRTQSLNIYGSQMEISVSPESNYSVLASLQPISAVKQSRRDGTFSVLDQYGELQYQIVRSTAADLKPLVARVSDQGILALADPVKAIVYLYSEGNLLSETQIYSSVPDYSMERKLFMNWIAGELVIILERPNPIDAPDQNAILIFMSADGLQQSTYRLPFVNILDHVVQDGHVIVSGYDYDPATELMSPEIVEMDRQGRIQWSNPFFGHELAISTNGRYVAALSSHELIHIFDLQTNQTEAIQFDHNNKASLGLAVNDAGEPAVIRVNLDFFVKQDTYFAQLYFPRTSESNEVQLKPKNRKLFQVYSYHEQFYMGTSYEWLRIRR